MPSTSWERLISSPLWMPLPGSSAAATRRRPRGARSVVTAVAGVMLVTGALALATSTPAAADSCPSASAGGQAIATIRLDDGAAVPIKSVSYPRGGVLTPPPSNKVAGLSTRHRPLDAAEGTSVIAWHVRYGPGCDGSLNPLLTRSVGQRFSVVMEDGASVDYEVVSRHVVRKGKYRPSWFRQDGPHRLLLATCSDLSGGVFQRTTVLFAEPVSPVS